MLWVEQVSPGVGGYVKVVRGNLLYEQDYKPQSLPFTIFAYYVMSAVIRNHKRENDMNSGNVLNIK